MMFDLVPLLFWNTHIRGRGRIDSAARGPTLTITTSVSPQRVHTCVVLARIKIDRIRELEDEIGELRKERKYAELKQRVNNLTEKQKPIHEAMEKLLENP